MRPILFALPLTLTTALLAACSPEPEVKRGPPEAPAPAAPATPMLAGVDLSQPLRLLGTEPFWGVQVTGDALVYSGVDRPEQRAPNPGPAITGTVATWDVTTDKGAQLKVMLTATECSDGMSDRTYPLTARVEIGGETLNGCAATVAALDRAGESGRVE